MDERHEPVLETFEGFFRREQRAVLGLAFVLSGSASVAEELAQDAFLAALRDWGRVGHLDDPSAWIRRVVANRSVSRFRRLAIETRHLSRSGRQEPAWPSGMEGAIYLWQEVRRLPKRQAQVIALHYLHDLSRHEVATILCCSEETVKTHLDRGRRTLAVRLLEPEEGQP